MYSNIMDRISFSSLFLVVVLLPIFFLPFTNISIETGKGLFLIIGLIVSIIFWIMARLSDGRINFPRSMCMLAGAGIVLVSFLSAIFSGASSASLFGIMLDVGSFWFIFSGFLLMLMSAITFREPQNARIVLFGTILSSTLVVIFQGLYLFMPKILSLSILVNKTDNILGSWNALGIFASFYVVFALFVIEFFPIKRWIKLALGTLIVFSIILIAVVNFIFVWKILGIFALLIFVYKVSINANKNQDGGKIHFPVFSFIIVLIALFFFMSPNFITEILPDRLLISNNEVSPSFLSTMLVTKSVLREHPVLGIGPNRFSEAWTLYKPAVINETQFWDVSFNSGFGLLPTLTATTGGLGILAWVSFLILFIIVGIKSLFFNIRNNVNLETVLFFLLSFYFFLFSFFYFTGTVIFLLAFAFAGVFIGLSRAGHENGEISLSFFNDHRKSFFSMLILVLAMIICVAVGFKYIQRFASVPYFLKTLGATNVEDAEVSIAKTLSLNTNDLYLRTYAQIYLTKLNTIASKNATSFSDTEKADLQTNLDQAVSGAQLAVSYNPKNYLNYQMLGSVFQTAGLIGVKTANDKALEAYQKASALNPLNSRIKLVMANVSLASNKTKEAQDYANQAITLKPDYIDALITLSQIAKSKGDTAKAISYGQQALALSPGNKDLIKYVDSLRNSSGENL